MFYRKEGTVLNDKSNKNNKFLYSTIIKITNRIPKKLFILKVILRFKNTKETG